MYFVSGYKSRFRVLVERGVGGHLIEQQPTIYDVAERAGVSTATVSRAINDESTVRPATRAKVFAAMEELKFVPNAIARGLSSGKHWIVGLVFIQTPIADDLLPIEDANLLFTDIVIRGAEARAAALGYSLLLSGVSGDHDASRSQLMNLTGTVDGLIMLDRVLDESESADLARRIPVVLLAGAASESVGTVRVDNEHAMIVLAEHLVHVHGVTRVGFVTGLDASPDSVARLGSFQAACNDLGATIADVDVLRGDWTSKGGDQVMRARLARNEPLPEVFACANDQTAVGVIYALSTRGIRVPGDVIVTGFDDNTVARYFNPRLTTIRQSGSLLGEAAVDALVSVMDGQRAITTTVLPTELVVRESCGCSHDVVGLERFMMTTTSEEMR